MGIADWIQFLSLLTALGALVLQQQLARKDARQKDERIETKLAIFKLLVDTGSADDHGRIYFPGLSEDEISSELTEKHFQVPESEVRKSLYEMLAEETIRYKTTGKYRPRLRYDKAVEAGDKPKAERPPSLGAAPDV